MSPVKKVLISLLITTVISIGVVVYASINGFSVFEKNIYAPAKTRQIQAETSKMADFYLQKQEQIINAISKFAAQKSSLTFFKRTISPEEQTEREQSLKQLENELPFLYGIRLVEKDALHIHFSTFYPDFIFEEKQLRSYQNYADTVDFELISTESTYFFCETVKDFIEASQIFFDSEENRLIFSLPAFDEDTAFRGTWLFYIDTYSLFSTAIQERLLSIGRNFSVIAKAERPQRQRGIVFNIPLGRQQNITSEILKTWETTEGTIIPINYTDVINYQKYILISTNIDSSFRIAQLCVAEDFSLSNEEKALLILGQYLVTFIIITLAFMAPASREAIVAKKIRTLEHALFREYSECPPDFPDELEKRLAKQKYGIFSTFRKAVAPKNNAERLDLNNQLEKSWQRLTNALLQTIFVNQAVFSTTKESTVQAGSLKESGANETQQSENNIKTFPHLEAEAQKTIEELEEIPPADLEELEELEELPPDDDLN